MADKGETYQGKDQERRRDEALRRALVMPPTTNKEIRKKKGKRAKSVSK